MSVILNGTDESIFWNESILAGLDEFTVSVFIKFNGDIGVDDSSVFSFNSGTYASNHRNQFAYDAVGGQSNPDSPECFKFGVFASTSDQVRESESYVQTSDWQHIIMTWKSGEGVFIWADGVKLSNTYSNGSGTGVIDTAPDFTIGRGWRWWNGLVKDIRLYDRQLSENEIITIYNNQSNDNIIDGLIFRENLDEQIEGTTVTTSHPKDLVGTLGDATTINGSPKYFYGD